jgi:hypothetical protein
MKLKKLAAAVVFSLAATVAQAGTFDPDGTGPALAINLGTFDWGPTSFLAQGGTLAIQNFVGTGGACGGGTLCNFSVLTSARLIGTLAPNNAINTPPGISANTFEITMIARFSETVTAASIAAQSATFQANHLAPSYVEIYFDGTPNANDLTGFGFNDGRLILTGTIANDAIGNFTVTTAPTAPSVVLDQHISDDYPTQLTRAGFGSNGNLDINVTGQDPTFFIQQLTALGLSFANISIALPFISVDPADCFNNAHASAIGSTGNVSTCDNVHVLGPYSAQGGPGNIPSTTLTNALFSGGPDFVAQTDNNSPVTFRTPEPGSLALVGLGLLGAAFGFRRKDSAGRAA